MCVKTGHQPIVQPQQHYDKERQDAVTHACRDSQVYPQQLRQIARHASLVVKDYLATQEAPSTQQYQQPM